MQIILIAADEKRDRQKFISKPLLRNRHDVRVLKTTPLYSFIYHLIIYFCKRRPDVMIIMSVNVQDLMAYCFAQLFHVPVVARFGGDRLRDLDSVTKSNLNGGHYFRWMKNKFDKRIVQYLLSRLQNVIVVNEGLAKKVTVHLKNPALTFVIPQFVEDSTFDKKYEIQESVELLTVANFKFHEKAKGVIWLIEQLNSFVKKNDFNFCLRVVGDGQHLKDIDNYIYTLDKSELLSIHLAGFVTELGPFYSHADLFIYRSLHDATPNVILESKRYALPLLANRCEEFASIVEHGVSGLLYRNDIDFRELLKQLLDDKELRKKMGCGAFLEHNTKFSIKTAQEKLDIALRVILKDSYTRNRNLKKEI